MFWGLLAAGSTLILHSGHLGPQTKSKSRWVCLIHRVNKDFPSPQMSNHSDHTQSWYKPHTAPCSEGKSSNHVCTGGRSWNCLLGSYDGTIKNSASVAGRAEGWWWQVLAARSGSVERVLQFSSTPTTPNSLPSFLHRCGWHHFPGNGLYGQSPSQSLLPGQKFPETNTNSYCVR